MKKSLLKVILAFTPLVCSSITFKPSSNNNQNKAIFIQEVEKESGPVFYAAGYSSNIQNEPQYSTQNSKTFSLMNFSLAPNRYRGESVKVAIIDSGINYSHEDFGDLEPESGTIDSTSGSWLYYKYGLGYESKLNDTLGHGTNVASVIASQINSLGCAGVAPNVDLYVFKVTNSSNGYEWTAINSALQYCIDNSIDVVNMSFQAYETAVSYNGSSMEASKNCSSALTTKINSCYNAGITLVGAAGNYNTNEPSYPASNNHVISVGSLADGSTSQKASFSNTYGIDLVAPGYVQVADKGSSNAYKDTSGTSFSAPLVTAAIALYKQKNPTATPSQIESALYASCDAVSGNPSWAGHGRLNVDRFLGLDANSPQSISITSPSTNSIELQVGDTYQLEYSVEPSTFTGGVEFTTYESGAISVSSTGLITALAEGEDTVSINPIGFSDINDEIDVTVTKKQTAETTKDLAITFKNESNDGSSELSASGVLDEIATGSSYVTSFSDLSKVYSGKSGLKLGSSNSIGKFTMNLSTSVSNYYTKSIAISMGKYGSDTGKFKLSPNGNAISQQFDPSSSTASYTFSEPIKISTIKIETTAKRAYFSGITFTIIDDSGSTSTKSLSSITVSGQKTSFTVGETFSFGGTVTAHYSDSTTANVTSSATFSGNDTSTAGQKTVTVSYTEGGVTKSTTYSINVTAAASTNYTVTFVANGGSGSMTSKTTSGSTYVTPSCTFTYDGYSFDKWALNSTSGTKYAAGSTISGITGNITLYATWTKNSSTTDDDFNGYYSSIDEDSSSLLADLRALNLSQRKRQVGYNNMGTGTKTNPDDCPYMYTDYDPSTVKYNSNNQPYGTKILSFYSGISTTSWNKEHVWPASRLTGGRDGNVVDDDVYMARPTISSENSDRGNSVFYEGMTSSTAGWDPVAAFASTLGVYQNIRGESARIIFYCMTVDSTLVLNDLTSNSGNNMGRLSDLLKWNLENPVNDREIRRQSGGQYLQGNRNAFVDHPEYACKIWGNTNSTTRSICAQQPTPNKTLTNLTVSGTPSKTTYFVGESFSPAGLTVTATFDDDTTLNVTNSVSWEPTSLTASTTSVTGSYTSNGVTKTVTVSGLTVKESSSGELTLVTNMNQLSDGDLVYLATGLTSNDVGVTGKSTKDATVSSSQSSWKQYTVVKSGTTYMLKDGTEYIGTVSENGFAYSSTGASITLDGSNNVKVGSRWFVKNGSNYRCYTSLGSYVPFHIYKVPTQVVPKVTALNIDPTSLTFDVYNDMNPKTITATVTADEGAEKTVTWTTSNSSVATVSTSGVVTPHAYGTATITAKAGDIEKTCSVQVNDSTPKAVTGVSLNKTTLSLSVGSTSNLVETISPSNATNKNVSWTTSDSSVATISSGTVSAVSIGTAIITVTTEDGGFTATCTITVTAAPVITYELEADATSVPYMSGTNHSASVGVKLYQYTNGVKGSQVSSGSANVDTSILGPQDISYTYQSVTYYAQIKVTNVGAKVGGTPEINISGSEFKNSMPSGWKQVGAGSDYASGNSPYLLKMDNTGDYFEYSPDNFTSNSKSITAAVSLKMIGGSASSSFTVYALVKNSSGSLVTSTDIKGTISISGSQNAVKTNISCTLNNPNGETIYGIRYVFTKGSNVGVSSASIKFEGVQADATSIQQAGAYADYFVRLTRTESTCKASDDNTKLAGLKEVWSELKTEYEAMVNGSKDSFCDDNENSEVLKHYQYIISKFGKSSKYGNDGLEDFVKDSKGNKPVVNSNAGLLSISNKLEPATIVTATVAVAGVIAIGLYFGIKKRKEI